MAEIQVGELSGVRIWKLRNGELRSSSIDFTWRKQRATPWIDPFNMLIEEVDYKNFVYECRRIYSGESYKGKFGYHALKEASVYFGELTAFWVPMVQMPHFMNA